jgi:heme exporter protein A
LEKRYGRKRVLRGVDLELGRGGCLVVTGPNGSGKTTLLRLCVGLALPSRGLLEIDVERARLGYLGHEPLLYRDLTVSENLRFHATLYGIEAPERRIDELLERVGMSRRAGELTRNLSAGMAQRAAVCRAVLHEPELLLLDEPSAHLDPEASELIAPLITAGAGRTCVTVTHDFRAGLAAGGRALALGHGGWAVYSGPAEGLSASDAEAIYRGALR